MQIVLDSYRLTYVIGLLLQVQQLPTFFIPTGHNPAIPLFPLLNNHLLKTFQQYLLTVAHFFHFYYFLPKKPPFKKYSNLVLNSLLTVTKNININRLSQLQFRSISRQVICRFVGYRIDSIHIESVHLQVRSISGRVNYEF